jgi:arylsulfatase A-like enzyme
MSNMRPNILMIMVDSLRPDFLGFSGRDPARTPNIDAIASGGVFMSQNICPMPSSVPSRATIFTGLFPHSHGLKTNDLPLSPENTTLAQVLSGERYSTVAIPSLDPGCEKGFSRIVPAEPSRDDVDPRSYDGHITTRITRSTTNWLGEKGGEGPWFLWVDYESIHEPWDPPEPFFSRFDDGYTGPEVCRPRMYQPDYDEEQVRHVRAMYDGEIAFVDEMLGEVMEALDGVGATENTVVVIVADHGVFLGEHGFFKKPPFLFEPLVRSTLIFNWPSGIDPGIVSTPTHVCDVMPTVLDIAGAPAPPSQGISLLPLFGEEDEGDRTVFCEFCEYKGTAVRAARTRDWKFIYHRSVGDIPWSNDYSPGEVFRAAGLSKEMLFDLEHDPGERDNISTKTKGPSDEMRRVMMDWMVDTDSRPS